MKKYLLTIVISLIVGFFLSKFLLEQYDNYNGVTVYNEGEMLYFIQYGVFSDYNSMEENTINLENYIYQIDDDMYYVYIGITKNSDNVEKMKNYFKNLGYDPIVKQFYITNEDFISAVDNYDKVLLLTNDSTVISEIISHGLNTYEEVVISES